MTSASPPTRRRARAPRAPRSTSPSIEIDHGDAARGWAMLDDAARRYPAHGLARPAIQPARPARRGAGRRRTPRSPGSTRTSRRRSAAPSRTRSSPTSARASSERAGDAAGRARRLPRDARARHPYPFGGLTDDALFHAAEIDEERGRSEEAIAAPARAARLARAARRVGSYERPRYSEAQLRIAEIYRDDLHDDAARPPRVRRALRRLHDDASSATTPSGPRRCLAREGRRRRRRVRRWRGASLDEFPESRYVALRARALPHRPRRAEARLRRLHPARADANAPRAEADAPSRQAAAASRDAPVEACAHGAAFARRRLLRAPRSRLSSSLRASLVVVVVVVVERRRRRRRLSSSSSRGSYFEVDAEVAELRLEQLEELVDVVAAPLVEDVGQELEEVAAVEAALDLFDLLLA